MSIINLKEKNSNFLITGGTGFLGKRICAELLKDSHKITILTRNSKLTETNQRIRYIKNLDDVDFDFDYIINLCGEPISVKWNEKNKEEIYRSRIEITKKLAIKINAAKQAPKLFISGSAIGYYGTSAEKDFTEKSLPTSQNLFSQRLCSDWENAAKNSGNKTRLVIMRTGIVLGKNGGILKKILPPFSFGLGGKIGSGQQFMSWIHIDDILGIVNFIINNDNISGAINATSPNYTTNLEFSKSVAKILKKPCFFNMPDLVAKVIFGNMAEELLLSGQKVLPERLLKSGYSFYFKNLDEALREEIVNR